nr:helix-turn-helix domain-containing protein [Streptomyces sp. S1D4-11]
MTTAIRARSMLTLTEFCEELSVSRSTFYGWRAKRRAPRCIKLPNGDLRIRRSDLDHWLDDREDAARPSSLPPGCRCLTAPRRLR